MTELIVTALLTFVLGLACSTWNTHRCHRAWACILALLASESPLRGLELVKRSRGILKRGTVYSHLGQLEELGFLVSEQRPDALGVGFPLRVYRLTLTAAQTDTLARAWVGRPILELQREYSR